MDRRTLIASLDVLSQAFKDENDPIAVDLRTMAFSVAEMDDEDRLAGEVEVEKEASDVEAKKYETFKCPECGTKVLKQTGYCVKCKKKVKEASEEVTEEISDFWTKEASDAVQRAILSDVLNIEADDEKEEEVEKTAEKAEEKVEKVEGKVEKEESEKNAGKIKGPGKPDGTGPYGGTEECQMKEEKESAKKEEKEEKEVAKEEKEEKEAEEKIVNTDVLSSIVFDGIEMENPMAVADLPEMSDQEKSNLSQLFATSEFSDSDKEKLEQLLK